MSMMSDEIERGQAVSGPPKFRAFAHVSMPCRDLEEGKRFYGKVLGGELHVETPTFASFRLCGVDVGIGSDGAISAVDVTDEYRKAFADEISERQRRGISAPGERADSFTFAPDLNTATRFDKLAVLLSQRGFSDARVEKVLGGNFARLFREVLT